MAAAITITIMPITNGFLLRLGAGPSKEDPLMQRGGAERNVFYPTLEEAAAAVPALVREATAERTH